MIKIKLEERHLDAAIEERKNTPKLDYESTCSCFVAQAAKEQVPGFHDCGYYSLHLQDEGDYHECHQRELMDFLTTSFDCFRYDKIRETLAEGTLELTFGEPE